ncbi:hypothetical protein [Paracoccus homiensis]|nr:hypothetical protein [Paracoccus homiensis]
MTEAWAQDDSYQTGDLADLVQSVIGTDGTADGALGFLNEGGGSCVAYPSIQVARRRNWSSTGKMGRPVLPKGSTQL